MSQSTSASPLTRLVTSMVGVSAALSVAACGPKAGPAGQPQQPSEAIPIGMGGWVKDCTAKGNRDVENEARQRVDLPGSNYAGLHTSADVKAACISQAQFISSNHLTPPKIHVSPLAPVSKPAPSADALGNQSDAALAAMLGQQQNQTSVSSTARPAARPGLKP